MKDFTSVKQECVCVCVFYLWLNIQVYHHGVNEFEGSD